MKSKYFKISVPEEVLNNVRNNLGLKCTDAGVVVSLLETAITGCTWHVPNITVKELSEESEQV